MGGLASHVSFGPKGGVTNPIPTSAVAVENSSRKVLNVVARSRANDREANRVKLKDRFRKRSNPFVYEYD